MPFSAPSFSTQEPCRCGLDPEPHYHVDLFTFVAWRRFQARRDEYLERARLLLERTPLPRRTDNCEGTQG